MAKSYPRNRNLGFDKVYWMLKAVCMGRVTLVVRDTGRFVNIELDATVTDALYSPWTGELLSLRERSANSCG